MTTPRNIALAGFMGCGKTTVGRLLAEHLGRPFVDLDAEIEARCRRTIAQIFAEEGEAGFRQRESELIAQVATVGGQVIACGGGALLDRQSRAVLERSGFIICLHANLEVTLRRLAGSRDRPLLLTEDAVASEARIAALWQQRRDHYNSFSLRLDTSGLTPEDVMQAAVALLLEA